MADVEKRKKSSASKTPRPKSARPKSTLDGKSRSKSKNPDCFDETNPLLCDVLKAWLEQHSAIAVNSLIDETVDNIAATNTLDDAFECILKSNLVPFESYLDLMVFLSDAVNDTLGDEDTDYVFDASRAFRHVKTHFDRVVDAHHDLVNTVDEDGDDSSEAGSDLEDGAGGD
jgi:hypothetical protein